MAVGGEIMGETGVEDAKEAYQRAKAEYGQIKSEHNSVVSQRKDALN